MSEIQTITSSELTTLGKRKTRSSGALVLHLESSPEPGQSVASESDVDYVSSGAKSESFDRKKKRYPCTFEGCNKIYSKPVRLAEHERSHTGLRPFVCQTCQKSYLRETHLQAHVRSHLPKSDRPLACSWEGCDKRFWTSQHLRVHLEWHSGAKHLPCPHDGCAEKFIKHNQLRNHIASSHSPPGTKPYQCQHPGCTKSFSTNQHLRTHSKVHDETRYTCSYISCLVSADNTPAYFGTWTALQAHIRTAHPPTCTHADCNNKIFASRKGFREHQKLHEQRELEANLEATVVDSDRDDDDNPPRKRRRGGEVGRDWKCDVEGCGKDFKSKKALTVHNKVSHLGQRDFICPRTDCGLSFGYKHLLQRHLAKVHSTTSAENGENPNDSGSESEAPDIASTIDMITGVAYKKKSLASTRGAKALSCPYSNLDGLEYTTSVETASRNTSSSSRGNCDYTFTRAYDLMRHMGTAHGVEITKESADRWVSTRKARN